MTPIRVLRVSSAPVSTTTFAATPNVNALLGQGGNDFLVGAGGVDYLNGGAGSDMFFFSSSHRRRRRLSGDIIQDFASGVDRFGISGANFGLGSPGGATLESWRFVSSSNANLATTQFGYDSPVAMSGTTLTGPAPQARSCLRRCSPARR